MLNGGESKPDAGPNAGPFQPLISDYKEYHTDCTVRFVIRMTNKQFQHAMDQGGLHKFFKLQKTVSLNNMVLFDSKGCLRRYDSPVDILNEFYTVRLALYGKRKEYLENMLGAECAKLDNIARFIVEKCDGKIKVENLRKNDLIKLLADRGYQSDPIKKWKEKITKERGYLHDSVGGDANKNVAIDEQDEIENKNQDYNYLLSMPLWNLTMEKKEEILKQQRQKGAELKALQAKTREQLWLDDLAEFKLELEKFEEREREEMEISIKKNVSKTAKGASSSNLKALKYEYLPSSDGERVQPKMDAQLLQKSEQQRLAQKVKKEENALNIVDIISTEASELGDEERKQLNEIAANLANPNRVKPTTGGSKAASGTPKKPAVKKEKIDGETNGHENGDHENGDVSIDAMVFILKKNTFLCLKDFKFIIFYIKGEQYSGEEKERAKEEAVWRFERD